MKGKRFADVTGVKTKKTEAPLGITKGELKKKGYKQWNTDWTSVPTPTECTMKVIKGVFVKKKKNNKK